MITLDVASLVVIAIGFVVWSLVMYECGKEDFVRRVKSPRFQSRLVSSNDSYRKPGFTHPEGLGGCYKRF